MEAVVIIFDCLGWIRKAAEGLSQLSSVPGLRGGQDQGQSQQAK